MWDRIRSALKGKDHAAALGPPVLIGATGGSGTRAVCHALQALGVFMGTRLNGAGDAMDFEPILDDGINAVLRTTGSLDYDPNSLDEHLRQPIVERYNDTAERHRGESPAKSLAWGWKNPRSMYLLPLIHTLFPDLVFVHLIRDGRDMALSSNQNQARKHFEALFGAAGDPDNPNDAIRLWATANTGVAAWGERFLGPRYLLIRFEDLCAEPELWLARIIAAMTEAGPKHSRLRIHGIQNAEIAQAAQGVAAPPSTGRWESLSEQQKSELETAGEDGLRRFGYMP